MKNLLETGLKINNIRTHFDLSPEMISRLDRLYNLLPQINKSPSELNEIQTITQNFRECVSKGILEGSSGRIKIEQQRLHFFSSLCLLLSDLEEFLFD